MTFRSVEASPPLSVSVAAAAAAAGASLGGSYSSAKYSALGNVRVHAIKAYSHTAKGLCASISSNDDWRMSLTFRIMVVAMQDPWVSSHHWS